MTVLASSWGVLALRPQQHHYPRHPLPSQRRCLSRCFDDPNRILRRLLTQSRPGSPRQRSRHLRLRYRDSLVLHRRLRQGLHLGGRQPVSRQTTLLARSWRLMDAFLHHLPFHSWS